MTGQTNENKITALYCRLSKDDGTMTESSSIQSQKEILTRYAKEHGFRNTEFYVDDGYSGTNFDRPEFQRMISDIEEGKISACLSKDLSRIGRNYLETGAYIEVFFPEHGVRYIAVNDGVDSAESGSIDFTPFRNIMNEMYAHDISKKIRSAKRARVMSGKFIAPKAPYGYRKDPEDRNKLIVDERHAPVVRKIFSLAKEGMGVKKIANHINKEHILTPAAVEESGRYSFLFDGEDDPKRYKWSSHVIRDILRNPEYAGHLVANKRYKPSFKSKKVIPILPEDYVIVENTHEPIVSQEDFDLVQRLITSRRSAPKRLNRIENIFAGLVKCEDCGMSMALYRGNRPIMDDPMDEYRLECNSYRAHGKSVCSAHLIEVRDLYEAVLGDIRRHARAAFKDEKKMADSLLKQLGTDRKKQSKAVSKELREKKSRLSQVDRLFQKLYEDRESGRISEHNYSVMSRKYEEEQDMLQKRIEEISTEASEEDSKADNAEQFTRLIKEYAGIKELDAALLNTLIEKITVGEKKKTKVGTTQKIKIYYKFIGIVP